MPKPILVANWKNYPSSLREAQSLVQNLKKNALIYKKITTFIAPPSAYLETAAGKIKGFANLASQDIFFKSEGTYTGAILPDILKSFGVRLAIIGHSERRAIGESDDVISLKIKTAIKAGIIPLLCVGETSRDEKGEYLEILRKQIFDSLDGLKRKDDASKLVIAYEPVWAVGAKAKGAAKPREVAEMVIFIRKVLSDKFGRDRANKIPILYGGSVDPTNASQLMSETGVRGFLVGRASLDESLFKGIASDII